MSGSALVITAIVVQLITNVAILALAVIAFRQRNEARRELKNADVAIHVRDVQLKALWPHVTCEHRAELT